MGKYGHPSKHKTFLKHLCNVGPTSETLGRRCTNVIPRNRHRESPVGAYSHSMMMCSLSHRPVTRSNLNFLQEIILFHMYFFFNFEVLNHPCSRPIVTCGPSPLFKSLLLQSVDFKSLNLDKLNIIAQQIGDIDPMLRCRRSPH